MMWEWTVHYYVLTICLLYAYYMLTISSFDQNILSTLLSYSKYMLSANDAIAATITLCRLSPRGIDALQYFNS